MNGYPHLTVATIVERNGQFLCVEERDNGRLVTNQPAGHVEPDETLVEAAIRETLEETQWRIEPIAILGQSLFKSPLNNTTYFRTTFIAKAIEFCEGQIMDSDIEQAVWLSMQDIEARKHALRSAMVLEDFYRYKKGESYPLELIKYL